jgi:hypothetical protein
LAQRKSRGTNKVGLWKLTPLMEIRKERGFPPRLEKSLAHSARLFHQFPQARRRGFIPNKGYQDKTCVASLRSPFVMLEFSLTNVITFCKIQLPASLRSDD